MEMLGTNPFANHVDRVLDATIRDNRNHRSVSDAQVLDAVDTELGVYNALVNAFGQTGSSTGI
jgi:hypothetical protein